MSSNVVIDVSGLAKVYRVYEKPSDRLKQTILGRIRRLFFLKPKKFYREFHALKPLSFSVGAGETVGIVGRNGSGKSTLLQLICGTLTSTGGHCSVNGRIAALLELGSGFNPEYTGLENVHLYGALLGLSRQQLNEKLDDILSFADIGDYVDQPVKTYSSGMIVRLAFSVAINVEPELLVVDEALAVGDVMFQRKCFSKIDEIKKSGATILFVSHSGGTVVELCDRALLLDGGELLLEGKPKAVMEHYHRLIYANKESAEVIREEIRALDLKVESDSQLPVEEKLTSVQEDTDLETLEQYDPNLRPKSSIAYDVNGAIIENARILSCEGRDVNLLLARRIYSYCYSVEVLSSVQNLKFGMMIKNIAGIEYGGYATTCELGKDVEVVNKGARCEVSFDFECNLAEGTYFLNAGVLGDSGAGETFLHRIFDATMFRVVSQPDVNITGAIDFKCVPKVLVLK